MWGLTSILQSLLQLAAIGFSFVKHVTDVKTVTIYHLQRKIMLHVYIKAGMPRKDIVCIMGKQRQAVGANRHLGQWPAGPRAGAAGPGAR